MSFRGRTSLPWPPAPSVEEEAESLSHEFSDYAHSDTEKDDSSVHSRGTIDQYPIILNADDAPPSSSTTSASGPRDGSSVRGRSSNKTLEGQSRTPTSDAGRRNVDRPNGQSGPSISTESQKKRNKVTFSENLDDRGRHSERPSLSKIDTQLSEATQAIAANGNGRRRAPSAYSMKPGLENDSSRRHSAEIYSVPGIPAPGAPVRPSAGERSTSESPFHRYMTSVNASDRERENQEKTRSGRHSSRAFERPPLDERNDHTLAWYSEDDTSSSRHRSGSRHGDKRINLRDKSRVPAENPLPYTSSSDESEGESRRRSRRSSHRPSREASTRRYPPTQPRSRFPESSLRHPYEAPPYEKQERRESSTHRESHAENPRTIGWPGATNVPYASQSMTPSRLVPQSPVQAPAPRYSNGSDPRAHGPVAHPEKQVRGRDTVSDKRPIPPPLPPMDSRPPTRARSLTSPQPITTDGRVRTFSPPSNESNVSPIDDRRSSYASDDGCGRPTRMITKQPAPWSAPPPTAWVQRPLPDPSKSQLALCPRSIPMAGYQDWYTISGLTHLDICPSCINQISGSPFREFFIPSLPKPRGLKVRCALSQPWVRLAWLQTIKQQHGNLDMLYQVTKPRSGSRPCPGRETYVQSWYRVIDPDTGRSVANFDSCSSCVRSIRIIFPSLHEVFKRPSSSLVQERMCDLRTDSPRFSRYIELLEEAAASTETPRRSKGRDRSRSRDRSRDRHGRRSPPPQPDLREFALYARRKSTLASCPRDRLVQGEWHYINELPEFTICEDCYDDVVWPLSNKSIASLVSRTRQFLPPPTTSTTSSSNSSTSSSSSSHSCVSTSFKPSGQCPRARPGPNGDLEFSCQLYSPRMRAKFREAVQWGDLAYLKAVALRRYEVEGLFREQKAVLLEDVENGYDRDAEMRVNAEEWKRTWE